jgi:glycosyltransferase involved in cell wall biosynthesis
MRLRLGTAREWNVATGRPWHVAVVVENVPLGVDTRLRKQVEDLLSAGFDVSVVTARHPDNAPYRGRPGLRVLEYPAPPEGRGVSGYAREYAVSLGWAALRLLALRRRGAIDVLQLCQPPDVYWPVAWLLRAAGARVVVDQRDLMPELVVSRGGSDRGPLMWVLGRLERETQRVAHATVTVNEHLRDRLVAAGCDPAAISVVRNGPVLRRVKDVESAASSSHEAAPTRGAHRFRVVWAGKIGPQDRVDEVVRLAEEVVLRRGRSDCEFVVLGDGECLHELEALSRGLGLADHVSFTGWVDERTLFGYLRDADLGVDTSLQVEVSPVKVMEYMALGLPFVCFDLKETRRISQDAAVLVPPGDLSALADAVVALLDDAPGRRRLGSQGRSRVEQDLAWERQAPVYLAAVSPPGSTGSTPAGSSAEESVRSLRAASVG